MADYRVHKHCRALDCTEWVVSRTRDHVAIFWAADHDTAFRLALGQVDRDRLIRRAHGNPISDTSKWVAAAADQWNDMRETFLSAVAGGQLSISRLSPISEIVGIAFDRGVMAIDLWSPPDGRTAAIPPAPTEFAGYDLLKSSKRAAIEAFSAEFYAQPQQTWVPADSQNPENR